MHTRVCVVCAQKQIMHTTSFTSFTSFTTPSVCILLVAGIHTRILCGVRDKNRFLQDEIEKDTKRTWPDFHFFREVLYCCFTAALLLKSKRTQSARGLTCISSARCFTAALLLLYCCFTADLHGLCEAKRLRRKRGRAAFALLLLYC
jgi:hypothetical protein